MQRLSAWLGTLSKRAENVLVLMMALMFCAFIAQVVFRYAINLPLGWTEELCTVLWLWGILWGASFVMKNTEDMRFDMAYNLLPRTARRVATVVASGAIVLILVGSLKASWSYVWFMRVEKSPSLPVSMGAIFSIYMIFVVAMVARHSQIVWEALRGKLVEDDNPVMNGAVETITAPKGSL